MRIPVSEVVKEGTTSGPIESPRPGWGLSYFDNRDSMLVFYLRPFHILVRVWRNETLRIKARIDTDWYDAEMERARRKGYAQGLEFSNLDRRKVYENGKDAGRKEYAEILEKYLNKDDDAQEPPTLQ